MTQLDPISADWLALREHADDRARGATVATLLPALARSLTGSSAAGDGHDPDRDATTARPPVLCVDLGTGTGANPRWLMPRLPVDQTWLLVDHDAGLLAELGERLAGTAVPWEPVDSDVAHLRGVLAAHRRPDQGVLVTCAALLDLLDAATVHDLAGILREARAHGLFSLSVDGSVDLSPADPLDDAIQAAFNAHQQRHGHLGPDGIRTLRDALDDGDGAGAGSTVTVQQTDWRLDAAESEDRALIERLLRDRADAVRDQVARTAAERPGTGAERTGVDLSGADVDAWLSGRLAAVRAGALRVRVGHQDLLVTPAR
ncbi:trans-aconitate methyltransferase [Tersicoccus solisilvae]|uniref:Trans-aconitate methyltransferase n=1 Tax=Tersicoccus solisilvae TaxID=1882339 RepID=A0ABQ1NS57_9MICC|nr:hypothetical protein [Tersicoccus solisilvae]GGC78751.1 trans-aconitate methyltransferase [Tersicoccus solisilvae]